MTGLSNGCGIRTNTGTLITFNCDGEGLGVPDMPEVKWNSDGTSDFSQFINEREV